MVVQGTASAAGTSVTIPAHQAGDFILITARGTAAAPTPPAAGGTVPNWLSIQGAFANAVGLTTRYCIATTSSHTSGVWTNATHVCVLVLRPDAGGTLSLAGSSGGAGNNTQTIIYPALTTVGPYPSMAIAIGTRGVADSEVGNPPSGYTNRIIQPAGASALMAVHTLHPVSGGSFTTSTVTTAGTNAAYRSHLIEVGEVAPHALTLDLNDTVAAADSLSPSLGLSANLSDSVTPSDSFSLSAGIGLSLADTVALADDPVLNVVGGDAPCMADAVCGTHLCGEAICGTWWACPKPAGLGLGGTAPQVITEDEQTPSAGLILATHPPGIVMEGEIDPPEAGLILGARVPDAALIIPPVVVSPGQGGLYLGTTIPGTIYIPPVVVLPGQAGLALGATVPLYRIDGGVAPFPAGLALGATPPTRAEKEWITAVPCEDLVLVSDPERTLVLVGAAGSGLDLAPDSEGELVLVGAATATIVLDPQECR